MTFIASFSIYPLARQLIVQLQLELKWIHLWHACRFNTNTHTFPLLEDTRPCLGEGNKKFTRSKLKIRINAKERNKIITRMNRL